MPTDQQHTTPQRPWYETPDRLIDPFKFRQHQMGVRPGPDTWAGLLDQLSNGEVVEFDQLLYAAHDCGRICGRGRAR